MEGDPWRPPPPQGSEVGMRERFTVPQGWAWPVGGQARALELCLSPSLQLTFRPEAGRPGGPGRRPPSPSSNTLHCEDTTAGLTVGGRALQPPPPGLLPTVSS